MQIKIYTIELNPPSWLRKVLLYGVMPLGVLLGTTMAVRAGVTLTTFTSGTPIKAADVNANFSALRAAIPQVTEWTSYTPQLVNFPTLADVTSTATSSAAYRRVGDSIEIRVVTTINTCAATSKTGGGTSYNLLWSLPNNLSYDTAIGGAVFGSAEAFGAGTGNVANVGIVGTNGSNGRYFGVELNGAPGGGATCAAAGVNGSFLIHVTLPIKGWTATTP